jgi:hypothetical protein
MARGDACGALIFQAEAVRQRLTFMKVEAMLWAQGLVLRRDQVKLDLVGARVYADPDAMRLVRWAILRLEGQGASSPCLRHRVFTVGP